MTPAEQSREALSKLQREDIQRLEGLSPDHLALLDRCARGEADVLPTGLTQADASAHWRERGYFLSKGMDSAAWRPKEGA